MSTDRYVPKGAASLRISAEGPAREFYFLLLPKLTMLAFSAALEPLRIANQLAQKPLYKWQAVTPDGLSITCSNGVKIQPDGPMEHVPKGASVFVCSGVEPLHSASKDVLAWIRHLDRQGIDLGGICTGAFALANAGVIRNRRFTLHWENQPAFVETFADLVPTENLYEIDRRLITCSGGNAATDMMLALIEEDHGRELALVVADMCIHKRSSDRQAPQRSSLSVILGTRNPKLLHAIQLMQHTVEDPMPLLDLCATLDISRRQLERLFKKYTAQSPTQFYYTLKLERAHALLSETDMSITQITAATGFNSTSHLARQFKAKYGVAPRDMRKGWARSVT